MFSSLLFTKHQEDCRNGFEGNRAALRAWSPRRVKRAPESQSGTLVRLRRKSQDETSVPKKPLRQSGNPRGETLAETVIALLILAIGITFSGTIMANSLGNITVSKNRVVAVNIAREGLEAMRNLRDTNWLRYSGNRRECWNHMPGTFLLDSCEDDTESIDPGDYILYKDENQRWRLSGPVAGFDNTQLYLMDIDAAQDTSGDNDPDNDEDIYNHRLTADNLPLLGNGDDSLGYENSKITLFKRVITLDYLTNAGASITDPASPLPLGPEHNRLVVTSRVTWPVGDRELEVTLRTHLTDYLGREDLTN